MFLSVPMAYKGTDWRRNVLRWQDEKKLEFEIEEASMCHQINEKLEEVFRKQRLQTRKGFMRKLI